MAQTSKAQLEARRWLANERAYAAVPTPDGTPDRVAELERVEEERRARLAPPSDSELAARARFAARKAALAAAKEAVAAAYATMRDAPLGELARRNDELIAADEAYKRLRREDQ